MGALSSRNIQEKQIIERIKSPGGGHESGRGHKGCGASKAGLDGREWAETRQHSWFDLAQATLWLLRLRLAREPTHAKGSRTWRAIGAAVWKLLPSSAS